VAFVRVQRRFGHDHREENVQGRPHHAHARQLGVRDDGAERVCVEHAETDERVVEHQCPT